uniref:C2H2-type domain-containing protein n=1 Tax=Panagrolaimus davidi TaxID=227884 RepID=A0A914NZJ1_9BILA
MNENSDAFMSKVHLFDDVLICGECRFRTNNINEFIDHKSRKCSNITKAPSEPKSIQCCENTFESSWKLLQHLTDKHNLNLYRDESTTDDSQERRGPQTLSPLPSKSVKSEKNHPAALIMNDDHNCIPNLQLNNPMTTTPTSMSYYSDPIVATHGTPPLTTSVSVAATPSVSSRSIGESHKNDSSYNNKNNIYRVKGARDVGTINQTNFNQNTTNFIICCLDSFKPFV